MRIPFIVFSIYAVSVFLGFGCTGRDADASAPHAIADAHTHDHDHNHRHDHDLAIQADAGPNPWTSLAINNDPRNFQFAIVTDRTGGHRAGVFEDAIRKLNLLQPEFVMSVGDLIEGYTKDPEQLARQWDEFRSFTARLTMPFFYVPGNHDLSNPVQQEEWHKRFGRTYYHFVYRDVLFLCLNSEDPSVAQMSDAQAEYVRRALVENRDVRWTLVFFHQPLWVYEDRAASGEGGRRAGATGWPKVEALLKGRRYTVFAGHEHDYTKYVRNDQRYFVLASTGGGSLLRGPAFGEFDHVAWVTMTDDGPLIANLMLSGIWDEDIATQESKKLVNSLAGAAQLIIQPVRQQDDSFTGTTAQVKLVNDANYPLAAVGHFSANDTLRPDPHAIDRIVPPNSASIIDVKLDPRRGGPVSLAELTPLRLDVSLSYEMPGGAKLQMQRAQSIAVDRAGAIPRRAAPVVLDGSLDEWKQLPITCRQPAQLTGDATAWKGPDDASFRFAVEHDDDHVYVALDVTDDRAQVTYGRPAKDYDGIDLRLDARPEDKRVSAGDDDPSQYLVLSLSPGEDEEPETKLRKPKQLPSGVSASSRQTERGFAAEFAIPATYLDKQQGGPWKSLRFNVTVNDSDDAGGRPVQIWWRPDWRGAGSYPGSGTFERQ